MQLSLEFTVHHSLFAIQELPFSAMPTPAKLKPLWRCPECGERFVTKNLWHSCGHFSLEQLFARSEPHVLQLFKSFERMVRKCGPVRTIPQKTRAAFQMRMRFAACYRRKSYLICTLVLPRVVNNPRVVKIEHYSPGCILHYLHLRSKTDLDRELQLWLRESYQVGAQTELSQQPQLNLRKVH